MSKETVAGIARAIAEAKGARNLRDQQETAGRQVESVRQEAERQALIARNEARLRATGVVDLFEALRDSGVLRYSETPQFEERKTWYGKKYSIKIADYEPARVKWASESDMPIKLDNEQFGVGSDRPIIVIEFDHYCVRSVTADGDGNHYSDDYSLCLAAKIAQNGALVVGQHEMKPGEELETVVRKEIIKLKEHKWEQQSKAPKS